MRSRRHFTDRAVAQSCRTSVLTGDNARTGLCGDHGFSDDDRKENTCRTGEIKDFTGISSPCEMPESPELHVATGAGTLRDCAGKVVEYLKQNGITGLETPVPEKQTTEV